MRKILSMLISCALALSILSACNTATDNPSSDPVPPEDGETQVETYETLDLVVDGASEYVIVRGGNASPSEVKASTELQSYLKRISGCEIPIVTDSAEPIDKEIVVGKTNREEAGMFDREELGSDGFVIKTVKNKLYLVGGELRGTLYSVYEFLEAYLGCGFYTVNVEKVPESKNITLNRIEEDKQIPVMAYRDLGWAAYAQDQNLYVKRRLNSSTGGALLSENGGGVTWSPYVHTFSSIVNYGVYGAEHPEYFAHTEDGTLIDNGGNPQLCLTNPDVLQIAIDTVKSWISADPTRNIVSVSQNDGGGPCMCAECKKVYAEENGSYSGTNIRFVNAVATAVAEVYPDVMIDTLAYQYSREACVTKPVENVIVRLCTIECCFTHSLGECPVQTFKPADSDVSTNSFAEDLMAWKQLCNNIYVWDYTTNFWIFTITFSTFETIKENVRFFADNNVRGIFEQGDGFTPSGEFNELRCYLLSRLLWDPYMSDEEYYGYMDEFLENVYGPGWKNIREYIDYRESVLKNHHAGCKMRDSDAMVIYELDKKVTVRETTAVPEDLTFEKIQNFEKMGLDEYLDYYTTINMPEIITKGYELFAKATELAETDSQRTELDKALIQVEVLESHYRYQLKKLQRTNVTLAVKNALNAMTDIDKSNINVYYSKVMAYYVKKLNDEYYAFNQALGNKMINYGILTIKEAWSADDYFYQDPDYAEMPRGW